MYSLKNVLSKNPVQISAAVIGVVNFALVVHWVKFGDPSTAIPALNTGLVGLLGLFVITNTTNSAKLSELNDAQLQAIDLGKQLAPVVTNVMNAPAPPVVTGPIPTPPPFVNPPQGPPTLSRKVAAKAAPRKKAAAKKAAVKKSRA